jgi:pimeloyl-ACP methyl ester carboxylesterase
MKGMLRLLLLVLVLPGLASCQDKESDRMVVFDDYQIHINETGVGEPTVIIEAALGSDLTSYNTLQTAISRLTRVLSYDRPGLGTSSKSPNPRTLPAYIDELKLLLEKESIPPPYILVGHSLGGSIVRYYAHQFPDDVAGLVLIDSPHEDWLEYIRTTHSDEEVKMFNTVVSPSQYTGATKEEWEQLEHNLGLLKGTEIPRHIPTRIITSTQYGRDQQSLGYRPDDMAIWAEMQASLMNNIKDARRVVTDKSGHSVHHSEPELIVKAVKELIEMNRNKPE